MELNLFETAFEYLDDPTEQDFVRFIKGMFIVDFSNVASLEKAQVFTEGFAKKFYNWSTKVDAEISYKRYWFYKESVSHRVVSWMESDSKEEKDFIERFNAILWHPRLKINTKNGVVRLRCWLAKPWDFKWIDDQIIMRIL